MIPEFRGALGDPDIDASNLYEETLDLTELSIELDQREEFESSGSIMIDLSILKRNQYYLS